MDSKRGIEDSDSFFFCTDKNGEQHWELELEKEHHVERIQISTKLHRLLKFNHLKNQEVDKYLLEALDKDRNIIFSTKLNKNAIQEYKL